MTPIDKKIIGSNLPMSERKLLFLGVLASTIFDTKRFKLNDDLHDYIAIYENAFNVVSKGGEKGFRPYVFKSRTLLVSRILKLIFKTTDIELLNLIFNKHVKYLNDVVPTKKKNKERHTTTLLEDLESEDD